MSSVPRGRIADEGFVDDGILTKSLLTMSLLMTDLLIMSLSLSSEIGASLVCRIENRTLYLRKPPVNESSLNKAIIVTGWCIVVAWPYRRETPLGAIFP